MIPANHNGQDRRDFLPLIIVSETAHLLVLLGAMHIIKILLMPQRLEISANEQQIKLHSYSFLHVLNLVVDFLKLAVQASLDSYLYK